MSRICEVLIIFFTFIFAEIGVGNMKINILSLIQGVMLQLPDSSGAGREIVIMTNVKFLLSFTSPKGAY